MIIIIYITILACQCVSVGQTDLTLSDLSSLEWFEWDAWKTQELDLLVLKYIK